MKGFGEWKLLREYSDFFVDYKGWINPDSFYRDGVSETFLYYDKLYMASEMPYCNRSSPHYMMLMSKELYEKLSGRFASSGNRISDIEYRRREKFAFDYRNSRGMDETLFGRMTRLLPEKFLKLFGDSGMDRDMPDSVDHVILVSFWNTNKSLYEEKLESCIEALKKRIVGVSVGDEIFVSLPDGWTKHTSNMGNMIGELGDKEKRRLDMWQKLHLADPMRKRDLMKELGVGGVRVGKRGEWERGMRDLGLPGYMTQSEGLIGGW